MPNHNNPTYISLGRFTRVNISTNTAAILANVANIPYQTNDVVVTGSITAIDTIALTFNNQNLPNCILTLTYTVQASDNLSSIVNNLTNLINANSSWGSPIW